MIEINKARLQTIERNVNLTWNMKHETKLELYWFWSIFRIDTMTLTGYIILGDNFWILEAISHLLESINQCIL